jgi:hypothetical protein
MRRAALLMMVVITVAACGSEASTVAKDRAEQAEDVAKQADLPADVSDFLALIARSATATYQVTYPAQSGAGTLVISQQPPNRRVDETDGRDLISSRITRDGVSYQCTPTAKGARATCQRVGTGVVSDGLFTPEALARTTADLRAAAAEYDFAVTERTIAGAKARCLKATAKPGRTSTSTATIDGTLCVSPQGVVLSVTRAAQVVDATGYTLDVPAGTFDVT